jgi:HEAT repeat protein
MERDPIARLRTADDKLDLTLRLDLLGLGLHLVPRLIDVLEDHGAGWGRVHAVDLLIDLRATEAIVPMLRVYSDELGTPDDTDIDEMRSVRIMVRLPELGHAVLEPALAFMADHADENTVYAASKVLTQLGIKDERIFDAVRRVFEVDEVLGAGMLARYGDERGAGVIERALGMFEPDFSSEWSKACVGDLLLAHRQLGGVLLHELHARVDGWLARWETRQAFVTEERSN